MLLNMKNWHKTIILMNKEGLNLKHKWLLS